MLALIRGSECESECWSTVKGSTEAISLFRASPQERVPVQFLAGSPWSTLQCRLDYNDARLLGAFASPEGKISRVGE